RERRQRRRRRRTSSFGGGRDHRGALASYAGERRRLRVSLRRQESLGGACCLVRDCARCSDAPPRAPSGLQSGGMLARAAMRQRPGGSSSVRAAAAD
ncbi:unnamed protein product, partial [Ixodes hexagonus]